MDIQLYNVYSIPAGENIAVKKNEIIKKAREQNQRFIFIVQDDLEIVEPTAYMDYISLMKKYNLGITFYGYYKNFNRILNTIPNPCSIVKVSEDRTEYFNRFVCQAFFCLDLNIIDFEFNEDFKFLDFEHFILESVKKQYIPLCGFYFDIPESWKYIKEKEDFDNNLYRKININELAQERKKMKKLIGNDIKPELSTENLFNFLKQYNDIPEIK